MLKFLKKIKPIYIIVGLFVIVILVSALGSKTIEGYTSGQYTALRPYINERNGIMNDINNFVQVQGTSWGSGSNFRSNLGNYLKLYTSLSTKSFFKSKDINNDGAVVVSKRDGTYIRDNTNDSSGNKLGIDEKLYYYDLGLMDKNNDGSIVSYKNTDQGNFFGDNKDNSGNPITASSLSGTPYILQTITSDETVTKATVDTAKALVDNQIALLTSTADKNTINASINKLLTVVDKIVSLTIIGDNSFSSADLYKYDPTYIDSNFRFREKIPYRRRDQYIRHNQYDDLDDYNTPYNHERRRDATRMKDKNTHRGVNYWKNLYLNSLNSKSNQQTPLYGSLLSPQPTIVTSSLVNPSFSSLLAQNSSPGDTGDATSGVGVGTGAGASARTGGAGAGASAAGISTRTSAAGAGISTRTGASAGSDAGAGTANYDISIGPVQPDAAASSPSSTSDAYLLNGSQSSAGNCPVGGCGTAGCSPNNFRPSPVPPCPPCERCPEPKFDCKRVPRYNSAGDSLYLPQPVLNDFSQFGM
jgi:hypothetical protein